MTQKRELESVIDEVRLLWNALVQYGDRLHQAEPITMGMRAVLEFLSKNGSMTVPNIARARRVSRQLIQGFVNELIAHGFVQTVSNPLHKRSSLIELTPIGSQKIRSMRRKEAQVLANADPGLSESNLREIANGLHAIRSALER
jgi:DNA-binding MarR family transcriptional regulator